jgi:citrate lyase subunit beta/citryl-CoA lyase
VIDWSTRPLRSLLFVPGSDERKLQRVADFGADAIVIDLEDAVADDEKTAARAKTYEAIGTFDDEQVVIVRVNGRSTGRMVEDIESVVRPELDAIMVPKVDDVEVLGEVDEVLAAAEERAGLASGSAGVFALIETARAVVGCDRILDSAPERVVTAVFGAGDFTVDIGVDLTSNALELLYARSRVVVATRAAGLISPIDGPFLDLRDHEGLEQDCARSRQLGFQGRVTVYPPQVVATQRAYSALDDAEVRGLRDLVEAFEDAERHGVASIRFSGRFVDYPIYQRARAKLARAADFEQERA